MENSATFNELLTTSHTPINCHFTKNAEDFVVREIPLYEFSGKGEHLILQIQKKGLTTQEALSWLSGFCGAKVRDFGTAGLKDKEGLTSQFVSVVGKFDFSNFSHPQLKILSQTRHDNKIRTGHLKGNAFFIRLKKVSPVEAKRLFSVVGELKERGFANYFGFQRFGKFGDNYKAGEEILLGKSRVKNPKMRNFFLSAYQSHLFNKWLSKRVELSRFASEFSPKELSKIYSLDEEVCRQVTQQKHFFKLLVGDALSHYPHGRLFLCEDLGAECERFSQKLITPTGLLAGSKAYEARGVAKGFEEAVCEEFLKQMNGTRRFAWVWAEGVKCEYNEEKWHFSISFELQKGSYATVFLREVLGREIFA